MYAPESGSGTKSDPYLITNKNELYWFADQVNTGATSIHAKLTKNITVNTNVLATDGSLKSGTFTEWTPIGSYNNQFAGTFDGQGYYISGLYLNNEGVQYVGLFGYLAEGGSISNVGVVKSYFSGYDYASGVCGYNDKGTIEKCYSSSTVNGHLYVGGVSGLSYGTIKNCYNTGLVSGAQYTGGVCGAIYETAMESCYNTGAVVSSSSSTGALCGYLGGTITNCYYDCTVYKGKPIGGYNQFLSEACPKTTEQFKSGSVAYLLNGSKSDGTPVWGQKIGTNASPVFKNSSNTVYAVTEGCVEYSNTQPETINKREHNVDGIFCSVCHDYAMPEQDENNIYIISNASNLYAFMELVNLGNTSASARLESDIVVNSNVLNSDGTLADGEFISWMPISGGTIYSPLQYTGTFDGNGHTISGLYFNDKDADCVGFFGCVAGDGKISKVGIIDSYFNGENYVGGVCGSNSGTIENCYNRSTVSGNDYIGGVCGTASTIKSCYSSGVLSSRSTSNIVYIGGVCGYGSTHITDCYYDNTVFNGDAIGGGSSYTNVLGKQTDKFANGEVAYLLNGSTSDGTLAWGQIIKTDAYPVFNNGKNTVYSSTNCITYSNSAMGHKDHDFGEDGTLLKCADCGSYKPAEKDTDDYYKLYDASQLYWFSDIVRNGDNGANAKLMNDITVNKNVLNDDGTLAKGEFVGWIPIGKYGAEYYGIFDGKGYTVSGLYYNGNDVEVNASYGGLIGFLNGTVRNVNVADSYFTNGIIGGVCGYSYGGTVEKCGSSASISNSGYTGGVCGVMKASGTIKNCYYTGTMLNVSESATNVGGIFGYNEYGTITRCYNNGKLDKENSSIGGICGNAYHGTMSYCYYNNDVFTGDAIRTGYVDTSNTVLGVKTAQFNSGEIAYKLQNVQQADENGETPLVWGQLIGKDASPVFYNGSNRIYLASGCRTYANTETKEHVQGNSGKCKDCGRDLVSFSVECALLSDKWVENVHKVNGEEIKEGTVTAEVEAGNSVVTCAIQYNAVMTDVVYYSLEIIGEEVNTGMRTYNKRLGDKAVCIDIAQIVYALEEGCDYTIVLTMYDETGKEICTREDYFTVE